MPQVACIGIALTALIIEREKESTSKFPEYTYEIFSKERSCHALHTEPDNHSFATASSSNQIAAFPF